MLRPRKALGEGGGVDYFRILQSRRCVPVPDKHGQFAGAKYGDVFDTARIQCMLKHTITSDE